MSSHWKATVDAPPANRTGPLGTQCSRICCVRRSSHKKPAISHAMPLLQPQQLLSWSAKMRDDAALCRTLGRVLSGRLRRFSRTTTQSRFMAIKFIDKIGECYFRTCVWMGKRFHIGWQYPGITCVDLFMDNRYKNEKLVMYTETKFRINLICSR